MEIYNKKHIFYIILEEYSMKNDFKCLNILEIGLTIIAVYTMIVTCILFTKLVIDKFNSNELVCEVEDERK